MKIRSGFVSNSSSSSFVILGTRMKREVLKKKGWFRDTDGNSGKNKPKDIQVYYGSTDAGYIVGIPLCDSKEWGLNNSEVTFEKLEQIRQDLLTLGLPNVRLLMGTRST